MGIVLVGGQLVQMEQALHHHPRHVQGAFQAALPLVVARRPDISRAFMTPSLVLQPHPCLGLLPLPRLPQEGSEVLQGLALAVEIEGNGQIHVEGVQCQVDLAVDRGLPADMVILVRLGDALPLPTTTTTTGGAGSMSGSTGAIAGSIGNRFSRGGKQSLMVRAEGQAVG